MAAALCLLKENKLSETDSLLAEIPDLDDCHAQYLSLVFKLHLAAQKEDITTEESLIQQINALHVVDDNLVKAYQALIVRDFPRAFHYETDSLLKLAA